MRSVIVHYQEIALKGRNRPWFHRQLVRNLRDATADLDVQVRPVMGRIEVKLKSSTDWEELQRRLQKVFGIANFSRAGRTRDSLDELAAAVLADVRDHTPASFRVSARRADKRFPLTSPQIERDLGGRLKQATGWPVNLSSPDLTINVEFLTGEAFYSFGKEPGPGGLPTGVSGRVACLLSGGIDSPVAAFRMMKRGCRVHLVHFHSYPIVSLASQEKVREIARLLTQYQLRTRLHLVAFGEIQRQVVLAVPPPPRVVIYRRLMMRIAESIARRTGAQALVTGEVVGQVASQTLENMAVIERAASLPVLRPLVGLDKGEITTAAQALGTYATSILPDEDCCQVFTPRHPLTKARLHQIEDLERALPIDALVQQAAEAAVKESFQFPVTQQVRA